MTRFVSCVCLLVLGATAFAEPTVDPALDARFRADIAAASPEAAAAWDQGNAARIAERLDEAEAAYRKASSLAPNVDHVHRRLCNVLVSTQRVDDAIRECEVALSLAPTSAYDKAALAQTLLSRGRGDDASRGGRLAHEAALAMPGDADIVRVDCGARLLARNAQDAATCVDHLLQLAPDDMIGNLIAAEVALAQGDVGLAHARVEVAKKAGLDAATYSQISSRIDGAKRLEEATSPISLRDMLVVGLPILGGWFAVLLLLMLVGRILSNAVLRGAGHVGADEAVTDRERRLRRAYRSVLVATGVLFYLSLPLLIFVVIAAGVVAFAVFDQMGGIPLIAIFIIIMVVGTTVISIGRALFFRPSPKIEGTKIDLGTVPKLGALLAETADAIETRRVDAVYLTPGTEAGVMEHNSLRRALFGKHNTRVLLLGVGLFEGMKQRELRAILAHEYGHFRNADTGGSRALAIKDSLVPLLQGIARSGYARLNPAWWLLRAFTRLYLNVSTGASRLQEQLADRWAIRAYGSEAFVHGLRHVVRREVMFAAEVSQTIKDVLANNWSLPNLYEYEPELKSPPSAFDAVIQKRMERMSKYDSHPPARQRIEWAEKAALPGTRSNADDQEPVWTLFPEPEKIEREMTAIIRERIRLKMGVTVSDAEWDDDDETEDSPAAN